MFLLDPEDVRLRSAVFSML